MATKRNLRGGRTVKLRNDVSLIMECVEEELSPAQKTAFKEAEDQYKTIIQKIAKLKTSSNTYITEIDKHDDPIPELDIIKNFPKNATNQTVTIFTPTTPTSGASTVSTLRAFKPANFHQTRVNNATSNGTTGVQMATVPDTGAQSAVPSSNDSAARALQTKLADNTDYNFTSSKYIQLFPTLGVNVMSRRQSIATYQQKVKELDERVRAYINVKGPEIPKWLTALGIMTQLPTCKLHASAPMTLQCIRPDKTASLLKASKWSCPHCSYWLPLHAGSPLNGFGLDLEFMIRLIYYWSIQAPLVTVIKDCLNSPFQINKVYTWLRSVCTNAMDDYVRFRGDDMKVEIAMECLGPCKDEQDVDLVCLFERRTMFLVMRALPSHNKNLATLVRDIVLKHVDKKVILYATTKLPPKEGMGLPNQIKYKLGPSDARHVPLSQWYIRSVKSTFVGKMKQLEFKTIQAFMDEICWRDTRGHTSPTHAFHQILQHAKESAKGKGKTLLAHPPPEIILLDDDDKGTSPPTKRGSDGATPAAKRRREEEEVLLEPVPLESYYYGFKDADKKEPDEIDKTLKFKCPVCKKMIENNIKMQRHVLAHIEVHRQQNMDLVDLTKCKYCFQEFETPFLMQCHVEKVHLEGSNSLACRICECAFQSSAELIQHVQVTHRQLEMPYSCECCHYRCSFYKKLLEHFESVHNASSKLQCQYCLKVFFYTKNSGTTYYWHMFKHQSRTVVRKCSSCCLTFISPQDFQSHRTADHESQRGMKGVRKNDVKDVTKTVLIRPPKHDTTRTPKIKIVRVKSGQVSGGSGNVTQRKAEKTPESLDYPSLRLVNVKNSKCIECLNSMTSETHFRRFSYCSTCQFASQCTRAFGEHKVWAHKEKSSKKVQYTTHNVKPTALTEKLHCTCGYSAEDGNELADHLVGCGKWTAYPTWNEAMGARYNIEEEAFSVTDVWIHTNRKQDEKKSAPAPPLPPPSEEENPDMLSLLGLMRRPVPSASKPVESAPSITATSEASPDIPLTSANATDKSNDTEPMSPKEGEKDSQKKEKGTERMEVDTVPCETSKEADKNDIENSSGAEGVTGEVTTVDKTSKVDETAENDEDKVVESEGEQHSPLTHAVVERVGEQHSPLTHAVVERVGEQHSPLTHAVIEHVVGEPPAGGGGDSEGEQHSPLTHAVMEEETDKSLQELNESQPSPMTHHIAEESDSPMTHNVGQINDQESRHGSENVSDKTGDVDEGNIAAETLVQEEAMDLETSIERPVDS